MMIKDNQQNQWLCGYMLNESERFKHESEFRLDFFRSTIIVLHVICNTRYERSILTIHPRFLDPLDVMCFYTACMLFI